MKRSLGLTLVALFLAACMTAQELPTERELEVDILTVSEVYGSPPKVAVPLRVQLGACEQLETRQRFLAEAKTFQLEVIGLPTDSADAECGTAQEYTETVILKDIFESGTYNVVAGEERATFTVPSDYEPETVAAAIQSVDVVLRETDPVQVVVYVNSYYGGCDDSYKDVSQRREGNMFFVDVSVLAFPPPEVPPCPPVEFSFTEQVTLETTDLAPGTYEVNVNGTVETFTLP